MTENETGPTVAERRPYHSRLEASGNRDIIYCHACSAEWWRDENGIEPCPSCGSDVTEVVNMTDDIRPPVVPARPPGTSPPPYPGRQSHDSDPEEADIGQYMAGSFAGPSSNTNPTDPSRNEYRRRPESPNSQERHQNDHEHEADRTVGGFSNLLVGLLGPAFAQHGQAVNEVRQRHEQQHEEAHQHAMNQSQPRNPLAFGFFGPPPRPGHGGPRPVVTTRVVFSAGNNPPLNFVSVNGQPVQDGIGPEADIAMLFGQMMGILDPNYAANRPDNPNDPHATNPLGAILASILNPGAAVAGDAVYSQEALDRIITQLMEQQSSTAPGPARQVDIDSLPLKKADVKMLFGEDEDAAKISVEKGEEDKGLKSNLGDDGKPKASCPVCMEDVHIGDTVCELGCKHWFHEECVKSWLGAHNTCPICRKPVGDNTQETAAQARDRQAAQGSGGEVDNSGQTSIGGGGLGIFGRPHPASPTQARPGPLSERLHDRLSSIRETAGVTYARRDSVTGEMGSFQPATGGFANPDSDAFADFLASGSQPSQPQISGSGGGLHRSDSFPLSSPHRENPLAQNPYVDNVRVSSALSGTTLSSTGGNSYCEGRGQSSGVDFNRNRRNYATAFPGASDDGRSDRSRGSRDSDRRPSGGGIWGMASNIWRRFSGQDDQGDGETREHEGR